MADTQDYLDQLQQGQDRERMAQEQADAAIRALGFDPAKIDQGVRHKTKNKLTQDGRLPEELKMLLTKEHPKEIAEHWLKDPKQREAFRKVLRADAQTLEGLGRPERFTPDVGTGGGRDFTGLLRQLEEIPVPFLRPDLKVHASDVDTPQERDAFLRKHHALDPMNLELLRQVVGYGGLSVEPTPFGPSRHAPHGTEWTSRDGPGPSEEAILRNAQAQGRTSLTQQEAALISQERAGSFRLEDDGFGIGRMAAKAALAGTFALGGALTGAGLAGAGLGAASGLGAAGGVGGTIPPAALSAGALGFPAAAGSAITGAGAGLGSGFAAGMLSGDPLTALQSAGVGGITGGLGGGLGAALGGGPLAGGGVGALTGGVGNAATQGFSGDNFDWLSLLRAVTTGGATGAASAMLGEGLNPNLARFAGVGPGIGGAFGKAMGGTDPLANANAQLDKAAIDRETAQQDAMTTAQAEWMAKYRAAAAAQQAAMLEAQREAQAQWESKRAEYEAKLQAFIAEREAQIAEALRVMGAGEPGIGALLAERRKEIETARAEAEQERQSMIQSRDFFPSAVLEQTPGASEFATSNVLVPHSPPSVLFGEEGLPASFADYSQPAAPQFSAEGLLPSGSLAAGSPPPAVAPLGRSSSSTRHFPTLLGALSRQPYLRVT